MVYYILIGILWGMFAVLMQYRKHGNHHLGITFLANAIAWPIMLLYAIAKALG